MSELKFKSAKPPREEGQEYDKTVVWDESKEDDNHVYLGDEITGKYVEHKENVGSHKSEVFVLELDNGTKVQIWGTTVLSDYFNRGNEGEAIPLGSMVRVTSLGKPAGKNYYRFDVQFAVISEAVKTQKQQKKVAPPVQETEDADEVDEDGSEVSDEDYT